MTYRPHDALFKAAFGAPADAAGLLQRVLPPAAVAAIDWSTLARQEGSFVDPDLADLHSDVLFSARLHGGSEALVYVLIEHQSGTHADMPLRILGYEVRIWERFRRTQPTGPRPPIIPVILAHVPGGWDEPCAFEALFAPTPDQLGLAAVLPHFTIRIVDLAEKTDEELRSWTLGTFQSWRSG